MNEIIIDDAIAGEVITESKVGISNGYGYEFWSDGGNGTMTLGNGGTFKCDWSRTKDKNILFRRGVRFPEPLKSHKTHGKISIVYNAIYSPANIGVSYFSVYGWIQNPLVEYYIVDNWGGDAFDNIKRPPGHWEEERTHKGTLAVDGGTYDIWTSKRIDKPSIEGRNTTFLQYWSVRQTRRTSGTIDVSAHFNKWQELGMPMSGGLYEVALTIEGFNNGGNAKVSQNTLLIKK